MGILKEVFGWLNIIGIPAIVTWVLYDRRRVRNQADRGQLENEELEQTLPDRVKSSSLITLEAELISLQKTFTADRELKENTIQWLSSQLAEARADILERDKLIDRLQEQLNILRTQMEDLQRELNQAKNNRRSP